MDKQHVHTLVIPDVHGRPFWKQAILEFPKKEFPKLKIVFLGDYLDPYENYPGVIEGEGWTREEAIDNFKEIIEFAKKDKRIHLLIGNHDMHYWYDAHYKSRVDTKNYNIIKDLFLKNFTLFNLAYEEKIDGVKYLYTHAGITKFWLQHLWFVGKNCIKRNKEYYHDKEGNPIKKKLPDERLPFNRMLKNMTLSARKINKMKLDFQGQANIWMCSWLRGGESDCGSCIWADFEEWTYENSVPDEKGVWQIFGHSWRCGGWDEGIIDHQKCIAMLDSRQAWVIDYEGEIKKLKEIL